MPQKQQNEVNFLELIQEEEWDQIRVAISDQHPADIADIINRSPQDSHEKLFAILPDEVKPFVLSELEGMADEDVLKSLSNIELSHIVEEMAPDDAADVIADLSEERSEKVLEMMEEEESEEVRRLLEYDEESAGGIMTTEVVSMSDSQTVEEAIHAIADIDTHEEFYYANIVDHNAKLTGYVSIWDLLREKNKSRPLKELVHSNFTVATVDMDQEKVAHLMNQYDLTVVPVVDNDGILVGRVTADDVIDVMEEEASEDILRLAGTDDAELENVSVLESCRIRIPWLLITLVGGIIMSFILKLFHDNLSHAIILTFFIPSIMAMGGNTGIQSSTLIVRSIALGNLEGRSVLKLLSREILIGAGMGTACGILIGIFTIVFSNYMAPGSLEPFQIALVVGGSLFSAMTFAATYGAMVPILLNKMDIDPAVASGPFITITNDISGLIIYFAVSLILIQTLS